MSAKIGSKPNPDESPKDVLPQQLSDFEITQIERRGFADLPILARRWLPRGKQMKGDYWISPNPKVPEDTGLRLSIDMKQGYWRDLHSGEKGRGAVSLFSYLTGMNRDQALRELLSMQKPIK